MHYKTSKFQYYLRSLGNIARWKLFPIQIEKELAQLSPQQQQLLKQRRDYYIKLDAIEGAQLTTTVSSFKRDGGIFYYLDLKQYLANFPGASKFNYCFGDITYVPQTPSFLKSRPIGDDNHNSVLLPLDSIRHFHFVDDRLGFLDKKDLVVWRGAARQEHRRRFLIDYVDHPLCNIGSVKGFDDQRYYKAYMTVAQQLEYKFILSLEGFDVATNLKWIMSSNSIAVMPELKYETWFMEGKLIPDVHYIRIKDDYSDFEERINFYLGHPDKCAQIIRNANEYVAGFKNLASERLLTMMVIDKYFSLVR